MKKRRAVQPPYNYRYSKAKAKQETQIHEWKNAFWYILGFIALVGWAGYATVNMFANEKYVQLGKAVDCIERPSFEYFAFCNARMDGAACTLASQSRMMQFYEPIDYACAQYEPQRPFVFPVNNEPETLEVAEVKG